MNKQKEKKHPVVRVRLAGYAILLLFCWGLYEWMKGDFLQPMGYGAFKPIEGISMMLGYAGFILIAVTLLIGPVKQWLPPKLTPYLLTIRRDAGILGGLAAILHVITVLIIFEQGPNFFLISEDYRADGWAGLFLSDDQYGPSRLNLSITGIANYMGALAFLFLLAMWLTSSSRAERLLGGAAWKRIHMSNLLIFALVTFHGVIYADAIKANPHSYPHFLWLASLLLLTRMAAFVTTVWRRK